MSEIKPIHTSCKKCVFSIYEGITQNGCCINYLDKYKNLGTEILEAYDEEKEFYVINDKKCLGYRENKWFDQFGSDLSIQDKINIFQGKNYLSYVLVIDLSTVTIHNLDSIFAQVSASDAKPEKIIIVRYRSEESYVPYNEIEAIIKQNNLGCSWRIQSMVDESMNYDQVIQHISIHHRKYRFVLSVNSYTDKVGSIVNMANNIVHKELKQFIAIADEDKNAVIYSGAVYRFGFANNTNILDNSTNYMIV